jgi:hypothetical protein
VLDLASFSTGAAQSSAVVTMPLLALALGAATAGLGRWLGRPPVTIAASGLIGPAMLCLAYLVAGPGSDTDKFQAAPYWGALVAVGAGTLGSVLATVARRPTFRSATPVEPSPVGTPAEQPVGAARPSLDPAIEPVFREPPTGEWSVPMPREGAASTSAPATSAAADETTASLPAVAPPGGRGGAFFPAAEPASASSSRASGFEEPTADLSPPSPPTPPAARPAPPAAPPPRARGARRSSAGRDPGAAEVATAFAAGRRAAGYSTGEIPVYSEPDERGSRDRAGGASTADEPSGRKARKRGKEKPPAAEEAAPRQRRGLFGRRRSTPDPAPAPPPESSEPTAALDVPTQRGGQPRPEPPLKPRDEEYVDWVSGLSGREPDPRDSSR